jgi:acetylornithine/succinyldiaminopimelate/putrescine aminotransferase
MKGVCDKYGALFIYDEIMCGTGRTGKMHAWQHDGVVPDIQVMGKGLGAGVQPVAAMLCNRRVADAISASSGFAHGHTYDNHPVVCAVGNAVLNIIQGLLSNIEAQGRLLGSLLREGLEDHPNVGDIRGKGLLWGVSYHMSQFLTGLTRTIDKTYPEQGHENPLRRQPPDTGASTPTRYHLLFINWTKWLTGWQRSRHTTSIYTLVVVVFMIKVVATSRSCPNIRAPKPIFERLRGAR